MSLDLLQCPTDCDSLLEPVQFDDCAPTLLNSEIVYWLMAKGDQPIANIEDPAELSERIDNTSTDDNAIRRLLGSGDFTSEDGAERAIPGGRINYGDNTYTGTLDLYDLNGVNWDFARSTGCNTQYRVWLIDSNGYVYGGNSGILAVIKAKPNITKSRDDLQTLTLTFKYKSKTLPVRDAYVLAADDDNLA